jgi:hypothetical protein
MKSKYANNFTFTIYACLAYLLLISFSVSGQDISFQAEAPKVVRAGEQFQLSYVLNENVDEFTPPNFGDFKYLGGPSTGSSTSISMVNGRTTRTSTYTFTYYLQAPVKVGKYSLASATAKYKRNDIRSNALDIEVIAVGSSAQSGTNANSGNQGDVTAAPGGENIYVRLEYDKKSAFVGEQITVWIKLYTQVNISGIDQQFKGPEFPGFYQQDVELPALTSLEREKVGDDIYYTGVIKKMLLFPQKSGDIAIEPFDMIVEVQKQSKRRSQSMFDDFFGPQYERSRINLTSNRVKFNIKPLPGNQPTGYSGAVGKFQINGNANLLHVKTNDAITFSIAITGKGNLKLIDDIQSSFPPAFDVFDPVRKAQLDNGNMGKSGKVTFEYTGIPRHAGNFNIPPFVLVYFDPETQKYNTISTQSFDIIVDKGDGDTTSIMSGNLSKEDIELLGSDIRFIESNTKLHPRSSFVFGSVGFYSVYIFSLLIFIVILIIRKERIKRSADIGRYRNRKASRIANKRLRKAHQLLKSNNIKEFYDELEQALWIYLSDKLRINFSELSKDKAEEEFKKRGVPEELTSDFFKLINSCEYARYAPGGMESEMSDILNESAKILNNLDQNL